MGDHLNFDNMEMDVEYECVKFRLLYASCGYYYTIKVRKVGETTNRTMIITDGCIFDKLEKFRLEFTRCKFSFRKMNVDSLNNTTHDIIVTDGDLDSVILS